MRVAVTGPVPATASVTAAVNVTHAGSESQDLRPHW